MPRSVLCPSSLHLQKAKSRSQILHPSAEMFTIQIAVKVCRRAHFKTTPCKLFMCSRRASDVSNDKEIVISSDTAQRKLPYFETCFRRMARGKEHRAWPQLFRLYKHLRNMLITSHDASALTALSLFQRCTPSLCLVLGLARPGPPMMVLLAGVPA